MFMRAPLQLDPTRPTSAREEVAAGIWLDSRLAVWLSDEKLLVVADLHWGYTASHRARGNLLPWWGDDDIESRLRALVADYEPGAMLWLGDVVHAAEGAARAERYLRQSPVPVIVLAGNHDRRWAGAHERQLRRGRYFFHHGDQECPVATGCIEMLGHHHPAINWGDGAGTRLKVPALVESGTRYILPAFSPWAAGTPWNDRLTPADKLWAIAPRRIFPVRLPSL